MPTPNGKQLALLVAAALVASCSGASTSGEAREAVERPHAASEREAEPREAEAEVVEESEPEAPEVRVAPEPPTRRRYAVAAIGDSLTAARGNGGRYLAYLRERCPESRFENFGVGGNMVNQMRRRFVDDVLPRARQFTHLLVFGGVNDLYSDESAGRTPALVARDLGSMYAGARERGLRVIALTVAPWGGFTRYYNERRAATTHEVNAWIRARATEGIIDHVIDAYALLSCGDPERLCPEHAHPVRDGLHFGPRGHEVLGAALHREVFADCL